MKPKKKDIEDYFKAKSISDVLIDNVVNENEKMNGEIEKWLEEDAAAVKVVRAFSSEDRLSQLYAECDAIDANKMVDAATFSQLLSKIERRQKRKLNFVYKLSATISAAVLLFLFLYKFDDTTNLPLESIPTKVVPVLITSDGKSINLDESSEKLIAIDGFTTVNCKEEILSYTTKPIATKDLKKVKYNTLVIPARHNYKVILEDSTEVILNANSELIYPTYFSGSERRVFLKGEAYFNVKKGLTPFIVNSYNVDIKVYGTKFNVNGSDSLRIKTALISGSVGVSVKGAEGEVMLKPNQMAITNTISKSSEVTDIDSDRYIAWVYGYFRYDSDNLGYILKDLSAWYNVEFIFDDSVKSIMTGSFDKSSTLESLLLSIEDATNVKFIKEGGRYRVRNNL